MSSLSSPSSAAINLRFVRYAEAQSAIHFVREQVFQQEQGVDAALEFDGQDADAIHLLAYVDDQPVGTARLRSLAAPPGQPQVKIERVAVLKTHRGTGIGKHIMLAAIDYLHHRGVTHLKLHAQTAVQSFYEGLGFVVTGPTFVEANIPHVSMEYNTPSGYSPNASS